MQSSRYLRRKRKERVREEEGFDKGEVNIVIHSWFPSIKKTSWHHVRLQWASSAENGIGEVYFPIFHIEVKTKSICERRDERGRWEIKVPRLFPLLLLRKHSFKKIRSTGYLHMQLFNMPITEKGSGMRGGRDCAKRQHFLFPPPSPPRKHWSQGRGFAEDWQII